MPCCLVTSAYGFQSPPEAGGVQRDQLVVPCGLNAAMGLGPSGISPLGLICGGTAKVGTRDRLRIQVHLVGDTHRAGGSWTQLRNQSSAWSMSRTVFRFLACHLLAV